MGFFDSLFKKSEKDLIKKGIEYIEDHKNEDAKKILKKTLENYPNSANALYLMGILTIKQNRTIALDYFNKAIKNKPNFEQAWLGKSLIFNSRLEFKKALNCIEKVLELNKENSEAIYLKKNYLFYLRKNEELERFKKELFYGKFSDSWGHITMLVLSDKGKVLGQLDETDDQNLFLFPAAFVDSNGNERFPDPRDFKTDKMGRLIINKNTITAIGHFIICKLDNKSQPKKSVVNLKKIVLDKALITTEGYLTGTVQKIDNDYLYLLFSDETDIRKFQLSKNNLIMLPINGIISIEDFIIYRSPDLDTKLIHKNHDEQSFIDRYFILDYPNDLKIKI